MAKMTFQKQTNNIVLGIYVSLVGGSSIMTCLSIIFLFAALMSSSEKLHDKMTLAILKAPVLFFDTNPVGRIMNRFSKDIGAMDDFIPLYLNACASIFFYFLAVLVLSGIINYWLIIIVASTIIVFFYICNIYLKGARDLARIQAILCSPVYDCVSETMEGLEVIHSLHMEERSVEKLYK